MSDNSWSSWVSLPKTAESLSAIGNYASSTASAVGSTAKTVWNSEAVASSSTAVRSGAATVAKGASSVWNSESVASGTSKVGEYAASASATLSSTAHNVWNSETLASGTSAVKSGATYAADGVKTWWNTPQEKRTDEETRSAEDGYRGTVLAMGKNASQYVVKTAGRSSNIVNFYDKSSISSLGNPRWWCRFDRPHGNVPFSHINMNSKLTGIPDPHIPISGATAKAAGYLGRVAEVANDVAPYLTAVAAIYEGYKVSQEVKKDCECGTTRNTIEQVSKVTGTYASAWAGAATGASAGTWLLPGIGTFFGAILGAIPAGYYGGQLSQSATQKTLDYYQLDTSSVRCPGCSVEYKKYQGSSGICQCSLKSKI